MSGSVEWYGIVGFNVPLEIRIITTVRWQILYAFNR